jgi:hypothetical protein
MLRAAVALAAGLAAAAGFATGVAAHQEGGQEADPAPFDCDHLPAGAVTRVPQAIQRFAELSCVPNGQLIVAREGWVWRYPASYFDQPNIAAYAPVVSRVEPGPRYFTSLAVEELSAEAASARNEALGKALPSYRADPPPRSMFRLVATNEMGHRFDVYFPMTDADKGWGAICAPECAPEMLFMIYRNR